MDLAKATRVFVYSFTVLVLLFRPVMCCEHDVGNHVRFNYDIWSKKGPYNWGNIQNDWYLCKNGTMQSPINLRKKWVDVAFNSGLQIQYQPSNATLLSAGHEVLMTWTGNAGYVLINGTKYVLEQSHWHSPSEHTINGIRYDLEVHMVHKSSEGRIAVIGAVYRLWKADPFLSSIEDALSCIAENREQERTVGVVDPSQIIGTSISSSKHFKYHGSLTTPPCSENVDWTVFRKVKKVAWEQIKLLRVAVRDETYKNARPLQRRNNRAVQLYLPSDDEGDD